MKLLIGFFVLLMTVSSSALAQIPKTMSYQGVLTDTSGNAVADGNYNLTFRIYDVASGGTEIWTETQSVAVIDGIFNAILGSVTPLNLSFDQPYWLGVSVEGGTELSPRIELTSAPYSLEPDSGSGGDGHSLDAADGDPTDVVYVDNEGKVGIGTVNPNEALVVGDSTDTINKNIRIRSQKDVALMLEADTDDLAEDDNPYISFLQDGKVVEGIIGMSGGSNIGPDGSPMTEARANALVFANKFSGARIQFMTNNGNDVGDRMNINGDGQVGIGTLAPNSNTKLHVESNDQYAAYFTSDLQIAGAHVVHAEYTGTGINFDPIAVYGRSAPADGWGYGGFFEGGSDGVVGIANEVGSGQRIGVNGLASNGTTTYGIYGSAFSGSVNNYAVYAAGNLAYTGNLINASDAKLKENIRPLTGSINKLMQLKPKSFRFTNDGQYAHMNLPKGEHYGLIAQEVEEVLPGLVSDNSHPSAAESRGEKSDDLPTSYKGLNYIELIPVLIEAIKEQQGRINQLEAKVNRLTSN